MGPVGRLGLEPLELKGNSTERHTQVFRLGKVLLPLEKFMPRYYYSKFLHATLTRDLVILRLRISNRSLNDLSETARPSTCAPLTPWEP